MRVAVLGASGFIGHTLVETLAAKGHQVFALVRSSSGTLGCDTLVVPQVDSASLDRAFAEIEPHAVINLAAAGVNPGDRTPLTLCEVNALLPAVIATAASRRGVSAMLHAGSSAEYAPSFEPSLLKESFALESSLLYGASKAAGTVMLQAIGNQLQLPVAIARLFNVFGPFEARHRLLPSLVAGLSEGKPVALSVGTQVRDFMHVQQVCVALVHLLEALFASPALAGVYNVCTGRGTSVADFARAVARALGSDEELLQFGALALRSDDLAHVVGNPARMAEAIRWCDEWSLERGVEIAVRSITVSQSPCDSVG